MPDRKNTSAAGGTARRSLLVATVVVALLCAVGFFSWKSRGTSSTPDSAKLTYEIKRGDMEVTVIEEGTLESGENTEIKCLVRGQNTVIWVVEGGTEVKQGDVLVRLDTLFMEEQINERSKYALWSRSAAEHSTASVARATLAIDEYLKGRYHAQLMTLEKDLAIAEANLLTATNMLEHAQLMYDRGYVSELEVEQKSFNVEQARLDVEVKKTDIDVLQRFTKKEELETLRGTLAADKARNQADIERAYADAHRRDRALEELEHCVIRAPRDGLVIYPSAAKWKTAPDIEEGATVHKDQILLLMPDLSNMQVKVGVHESIVDRVRPGLPARVRLTDRKLTGKVTEVASVTQPAGWWTGNVVKYDTTISLPDEVGLKPGMSAEIEIILDTYRDVLKIPVAAVAETNDGYYCWVKTESKPERRKLQLGDSNDLFIVVEDGLQEGDEVLLNPLAFVDEIKDELLQPLDATQATSPPDADQSTQSPPMTDSEGTSQSNATAAESSSA